MKKKQLQSLRLNKKVISGFTTEKAKGGRAARTGAGSPCPGSAGGPCTSIQIPCSHQDTCQKD
jgi:hypothetical protein